MNGILKGIQSVLIALIILALIGTGVILWYNNNGSGTETETSASIEETETQTETADFSEDTSLPPGTDDTELINTSATQHVHSYTSSVINRPDCTHVGMMQYTCSCGDFYTDIIAALDHKRGDWEIVRAATRREDGLRRRRCTRCNTILDEEVIDKSTVSGNSVSDNDDGHVHSYVASVTTEASCTTNGENTYTCSCGSSYKASIPATNHPSRQTLVTDATCTEPGSVETSCAICKAVLSHDSIPSLGHTFGSWTVVTYPTADAEGSEERTCSRCDEKETRTLPKVEAGVNHTHSYSSNITTAATCLTAGSATYTCTCGDTYTDTVAALGHNPGNWVTVSQPSADSPGLRERYCRRCGEVVESEDLPYVEECAHSYSSTITRQPTCQRTGTRTFTCSKCGDSYTASIDLIDHKYVVEYEPDGVTPLRRTCNMCGQADPSFSTP